MESCGESNLPLPGVKSQFLDNLGDSPVGTKVEIK
jgi:hypothetical protein